MKDYLQSTFTLKARFRARPGSAEDFVSSSVSKLVAADALIARMTFRMLSAALHVSPPTFTDVCPRSRSPGNAVPPKCMVGRGIGNELHEQGLTLQGTVPRAAATKQVRRDGAQKQFAVALTVKHLRLNERPKTKLSCQQLRACSRQ